MMNKLFFKITAGILTAAIFVVSCSKDQSKKTTTASTTAVADKPVEPIVYVNSDSLLENYSYFKDLRSRMESKSKKAQADLAAKGNSFQREVAEYQQSAQTLSADVRAATEQRLARKQQELQTFNQNASSALANESAAENEKLYEKVAAYLKVYAKKKGYKMVLTYSKANSAVLYADESLDVTKEVVSGLNDAYKSEKK
jgi:outer membrane protein